MHNQITNTQLANEIISAMTLPLRQVAVYGQRSLPTRAALISHFERIDRIRRQLADELDSALQVPKKSFPFPATDEQIRRRLKIKNATMTKSYGNRETGMRMTVRWNGDDYPQPAHTDIAVFKYGEDECVESHTVRNVCDLPDEREIEKIAAAMCAKYDLIRPF